MQSTLTKIQAAGLSRKEAEVYLGLLKNQSVPAGKLAKILNMDRVHTYNVLHNLINKGLVSSVEENNISQYIACSPNHLLNQLRSKEQEVLSVIPELENISVPPSSSITVLEGKEGLKTAIQTLLHMKIRGMCILAGSANSYALLPYDMPKIEKNLKVEDSRLIAGKKLKKHSMTKIPGISTRFLDEVSPTSTVVVGDLVLIAMFEPKISIIKVESRTLAKSYKKYFEYLWSQATP